MGPTLRPIERVGVQGAWSQCCSPRPRRQACLLKGCEQPFVPAHCKPGTAAPLFRRGLVVGAAGEPAGSIAIATRANHGAVSNHAVIASGCGRRKIGAIRPGRRARASAQPTILKNLVALALAAMSYSCPAAARR